MDTSAVDHFINKYKEEINELKMKLSLINNSEDEFNLLQKLADSYYILSEQYKRRFNYLTKLALDYDEMIFAKRQSFIYIEKSLSLLRRSEVDVVQNAHWFVKNIGFEYDYLGTHNGTIPNDLELYYSAYSPYPNIALNILLNNISDYQRLVGIWIDKAENDHNYNNLFIYSEVMGDLCLLKQLLIEDLVDVNVIRYTDNAHFAYHYYNKAINNRHSVDRRETATFGLVDTDGYNYQDVMYLITEKLELPNIVRCMLEEKIQFVSRLYPNTINKTDFPIFRSRTHEKLNSLMKTNNIPIIEGHDTIFRQLCEWVADMVNKAYDNPKYYRKDAQYWEKEGEMHIWMERELTIFEAHTGHRYHREAESAGGNCEHWIANIPLEDKLVSNYNDIEAIREFLKTIYDEYSGQVIRYAEGKKSKYGLLIIADTREKIKNHQIRPSPCHQCINIYYDKEYKIWTCVFVFQAFTKSPSNPTVRKLKDRRY